MTDRATRSPLRLVIAAELLIIALALIPLPALRAASRARAKRGFVAEAPGDVTASSARTACKPDTAAKRIVAKPDSACAHGATR